jgi:carboxyl-terminal processing protease
MEEIDTGGQNNGHDKKMLGRKYQVLIVVLSLILVTACFLVPFILTRKTSSPPAASVSNTQSLSDMEKVLEASQAYQDAEKIVENNYVDSVNSDELLKAAARGIERLYEQGADRQTVEERGIVAMLDSLYDPFSSFMSPDEVKALDSQLSGRVSGIGAVMQSVKNEVRVHQTLDGSPAQAAGLKEGDIVREVDGRDVSGMSLNDVVDLIRGAEGTTVHLGIMRPGSEGIMYFDIVRKNLEIPNAESSIKRPGIGYISLSDWSTDVDRKISADLKDLKAKGATSLIIDLRGNGGGYMEPAVTAADLFLSKGTIVSQRGRIAGTTRDYKADGATEWDGPVVLLVDRGSASASEIFASALHDNKRCTLVGETTFGKGMVQKLFRQDDGSAIRLTVARYYTPSGASINDQGITPDVVVKNPGNGQDAQMDKALELAGQ